MKTTVARLYRFRATHSLPEFPEPWCFPHEHDYTVEVVADGGTDTDRLDQRWATFGPAAGEPAPNLNAWFHPTTVENIATHLLKRFGELAVAVTVWEDQARWGRADRRGDGQ
jgi:hypothetical protein